MKEHYLAHVRSAAFVSRASLHVVSTIILPRHLTRVSLYVRRCEKEESRCTELGLWKTRRSEIAAERRLEARWIEACIERLQISFTKIHKGVVAGCGGGFWDD